MPGGGGASVDPHDKMRARDVNKVARGEQAPRPSYEPSDVSRPPPPTSVHTPNKHDHEADNNGSVDGGKGVAEIDEVGTAPADGRLPATNQTRHCYTRYIEYHKCIQAKGAGAQECEKFAKYYRSLCPSEWIERWNEQRELGIFPGPL